MAEVKKAESAFIKWLYEIDKTSGPIAGGKGANLAEMFNNKFPVPPAFIITTKAYEYFIEKTGIKSKIYEILDSINVDNTGELEEKSKQIRELMINAEMPEELKEEIIESYEDLGINKESFGTAKGNALNILKHSREPVFVAVRSSATTEDLDDSSFAGQQETYLDIKGNINLIDAVIKVLASLFTSRAIYYRKKRGFEKEKFALAVVVQKMIDSEKSGVIFSKNPIKENNNVTIEAVFGLGEGIVSGRIKPDNYEVSRELKILNEQISVKKIALARNSQGEIETIRLNEEKSREKVLTDSEIRQIANLALQIEEHYGKPQDIEFAIESNSLFIVQSRPITTKAKESSRKIEGKEILSGFGASPGIASGKVKIIKNIKELSKVQKGDILVAKMTNPDMVVTMQKSSAIITDEGGITSHASIVSREMGIPAVVGTENATTELKEGQIVTVDGYTGKVYSGESETIKAEIKPVIQTKIKIKVILDLPEAAERAAKTKVEAIGLLRLEGIIASSKKHPLEFIKQGKEKEYSELLKKGIEKISEPFKEIWVRTSDIRTDEFENLDGAPKIEGNPMLGNHGIRFSLKHPEILKSEFNAIKQCVEKYKDKKFGVMFPQVISKQEIIKAKEIAESVGLKNVKIGIMVETPAACLAIKELIEAGIDFVSFGTNDLTQYILAIDRNNEEVQDIYNEMNPAVLNAIKKVLIICNERNVETSICGQAGSSKPMVKFLVENNIKSISANADAAFEISQYVTELENSTQNKKPYNKPEQKHIPNNKITNQRENKWNKKNKWKNKFKNKSENKEKSYSPQEKIQNIIQKAENEKQEIIEKIKEKDKTKYISFNGEGSENDEPEPYPEPEPQPDNSDEPEEPIPVIQKQEHEIPKYVENTIDAIKQLFEGDNIEKDNTFSKVKLQEEIPDEDEEVLDIF